MDKSKYLTTLSFIKWTLRNNVLAIIIYSVLIFINSALNSFSYSPMLDWYNILITCGYILIISSKMCGYLHNKRKSDVYNSLPLSNLNLYINNYVAGLATILVPVLISITSMAVMNDGLNLGMYLLFYIVSCTLLYTFSMTIGVLCYKKRDMISTIIIFAIAIPIVITYFSTTLSSFIPGYVTDIYNTTNLETNYILFFISPAIAVMLSSQNLYYYNEGSTESFNFDIQLILIATIVLFVIGLLVARKRKAELVENTYSINVIPVLSTAIIASVGCYIIYLIVAITINLYAITIDGNIDPMLVFVITLLSFAIISIIIYFISMKLIYKCSMPKTKNIISCLLVVTITCSIFAIIATGVFGLDINTPKVEDVKKAHIQLSVERNGYDQLDSAYDRAGNDYDDDDYNMFPTYTEEEDIQQIIDTNKLIADFIREYSVYPYIINTSSMPSEIENVIENSVYYEEDSTDARIFYIRYDMETGGDVVKEYYLSDIVNSTAPDSEKDKVMQAIQDLANTTEFKEAYTDNLLTDTSDFVWRDLVEREYIEKGEARSTYYDADSSKSDLMYEFNEAFKKDVLADDEFYFNMYDERNEELKYYVKLESENYIYVPKSYTNTLEVWDELSKVLVKNARIESDDYESSYYSRDFTYETYEAEFYENEYGETIEVETTTE